MNVLSTSELNSASAYPKARLKPTSVELAPDWDHSDALPPELQRHGDSGDLTKSREPRLVSCLHC